MHQAGFGRPGVEVWRPASPARNAPSLGLRGWSRARAAHNPICAPQEPHLWRLSPLVGLRVVLLPAFAPNVCLTPSPGTGRIPSR